MRALGPGFEIHFRGSARRLQGIEALAHQFEDAAVIEVGAHYVAEFDRPAAAREAILGAKSATATRGFGYAQARAGAKPILCGGRRSGNKEKRATDKHAIDTDRSMREIFSEGLSSTSASCPSFLRPSCQIIESVRLRPLSNLAAKLKPEFDRHAASRNNSTGVPTSGSNSKSRATPNCPPNGCRWIASSARS